MPRRMSCSMTVEAVRNRTKTVTRRHVDTWGTLKPGDRLTLIEKGMGLKKGEKQVVLAEVEVVDVEVQSILEVFPDERRLEGVDPSNPASGDFERDMQWARWWADHHGYSGKPLHRVPCRRIEWRYLDDTPTKPKEAQR